MKWKKIDPDNLPQVEVLGACFDENSHSYKHRCIGYLRRVIEDNDDYIYCESTEIFGGIPDCTHYIDIHSFDNERE